MTPTRGETVKMPFVTVATPSSLSFLLLHVVKRYRLVMFAPLMVNVCDLADVL